MRTLIALSMIVLCATSCGRDPGPAKRSYAAVVEDAVVVQDSIPAAVLAVRAVVREHEDDPQVAVMAERLLTVLRSWEDLRDSLIAHGQEVEALSEPGWLEVLARRLVANLAPAAESAAIRWLESLQ